MAFHIELRVNLVKTLQVPIFYSSYQRLSDCPVPVKTDVGHVDLVFLTSWFGLMTDAALFDSALVDEALLK
jgi:hypothetical protein